MQPPNTSPALDASEPVPSNVISLPLILLLGCAPETEAHCRSIALRAHALVRVARLPFQRSRGRGPEPAGDRRPGLRLRERPWGFEVLAEKVGASLLMLERDPMAPIVLEYRMMDALVFATRLRARMREAARGRR